MPRVPLRAVARARSGDKGDSCDISLFAPTPALYEVFCRELTPERVQAHFAGWIVGPVQRYLVPNLLALKFVCHGALGGGASRSLRLDNLGKCFGPNLLRMELDIDEALLVGVARRGPEEV